MPAAEVRFTDVLTTASSIASYLAAPDVSPATLLDAIAVLLGEKTIDDFGRPLSPMVRRAEPAVSPGVRALAMRWYERLGSDVTATLDDTAIAELRADIAALAAEPGA